MFERDDDMRRLLQRKADAKLKPKAPQQPADHGLFSDESQQTDLIDLARRTQPCAN